MDIQSVLVVLLALLTINLIAVGIYLVIVLREFRVTVRKSNAILDDVKKMTDAVSGPIVAASEFAAGISSALKIFSSFKFMKKDRKEN